MTRRPAFPVPLLALLGLLCVHTTAWNEEPQRLRIEFAPRASANEPADQTLLVKAVADAPTVDGKLDDACWQEASKAGGFFNAADGQEAKLTTEALVCYAKETLYIGLTCYEAPQTPTGSTEFAENNSVELLFDSVHGEQSFCGIVVKPDGSWRELVPAGGGKRWTSKAQVACSREGDRWLVELAVPKSAFEDTENALWGFNMVRRSGGPPPIVMTWNRLQGDPRRPDAFGHIAFETRPCYIKAVRFGPVHRGHNTLTVAIINSEPVNMDLRALAAVTEEDSKPQTTRYKFSLPAREGQWLAFELDLKASKSCDVVFALSDGKTGQWLTGFRRRHVTIPPMVTLECSGTPDKEGRVVARCLLHLPDELLQASQLTVSLQGTKERGTKAYVQKSKLPSQEAKISLSTAGLAPDTYLLRAIVTVPRLGTDSAAASVTVPEP